MFKKTFLTLFNMDRTIKIFLLVWQFHFLFIWSYLVLQTVNKFNVVEIKHFFKPHWYYETGKAVLKNG